MASTRNRAPQLTARRQNLVLKASPRLDAAGATASFLCALHCALMPFVVTVLPLLGLSFLASEPVEWALVALSATLGIGSLCLGYRAHRSRRALAVLSAGLALLVLGRVAEERGWELYGVPLMVCGGLTIMTAHFINLRLCRACRVCRPDSSDHE